ncbi:MAG: hypothetical protein QOD69_3090 [Solirubrobacteraceae bacterium]|nr:hypothetical protein [Solirubrobacteraceae bacterium]
MRTTGTPRAVPAAALALALTAALAGCGTATPALLKVGSTDPQPGDRRTEAQAPTPDGYELRDAAHDKALVFKEVGGCLVGVTINTLGAIPGTVGELSAGQRANAARRGHVQRDVLTSGREERWSETYDGIYSVNVFRRMPGSARVSWSYVWSILKDAGDGGSCAGEDRRDAMREARRVIDRMSTQLRVTVRARSDAQPS